MSGTLGASLRPPRRRQRTADARSTTAATAPSSVGDELLAPRTVTLRRTNSVNRAFDGLGSTREFYKEVFDRDSIDGHGMR